MAYRAPVVLAPYSPAWPAMFAAERSTLVELFPPSVFQIEHVGSTAVPGLAAKPIIDIMLGTSALGEVESKITQLLRLGYEYLPEYEQAIPNRRFFAKPKTQPRIFHLHAVIFGDEFWTSHVVFRDTLRANPQIAAEYDALKHALAAKFGDDREGYTDAKTAFIANVVRDALREPS
jgi:GrpB-like predicted nucleotidyltransferase (UPF0157 family)